MPVPCSRNFHGSHRISHRFSHPVREKVRRAHLVHELLVDDPSSLFGKAFCFEENGRTFRSGLVFTADRQSHNRSYGQCQYSFHRIYFTETFITGAQPSSVSADSGRESSIPTGIPSFEVSTMPAARVYFPAGMFSGTNSKS